MVRRSVGSSLSYLRAIDGRIPALLTMVTKCRKYLTTRALSQSRRSSLPLQLEVSAVSRTLRTILHYQIRPASTRSPLQRHRQSMDHGLSSAIAISGPVTSLTTSTEKKTNFPAQVNMMMSKKPLSGSQLRSQTTLCGSLLMDTP